MLLEALIGIVIFSVGVLALIGLHAVSLKNTADAKYRTDAAMLANQLVAEIWAGPKDLATMQSRYASPSGTVFSPWAATLGQQLPDVAAAGAPTVTIAQQAAPAGLYNPLTQVTVTINWKVPGQQTNRYTIVTQLNCTTTDSTNSACTW